MTTPTTPATSTKSITLVALAAKIGVSAAYLHQIWLDYFVPPSPGAAEPLGMLPLTGLFLLALSLVFVLEYRLKMQATGTLPQRRKKP